MKHMLEGAGAAYADPRCMKGDCLVFTRQRLSPEGSVKGEGHALCTCGERSPHLMTYQARKRWMAEHRAATAEREAAVA